MEEMLCVVLIFICFTISLDLKFFLQKDYFADLFVYFCWKILVLKIFSHGQVLMNEI